MDSKLLVFVVLATLGHSAFARRSTSSSYERISSEEDRSVLSKLRANYAAVVSLAYEVNISLYDYIKELVFGYLCNLQRTTSDDIKAAAIIAEANRKDKMRFDRMLDAIPFALKKRCDNLETTRTTIHANLDATYSSMLHEIKLALNGRYSERKESTLVASAVGLIRGFFNLIRHCHKIADANTLAAIKTAENRSFTAIYHEAASISNSLKVFATVVASGNKDETLVHEIDAAMSRGLAAARADTDNKGAILEALYYNSVSNRRGIMRDLFFNRHAAIVICANYKEIVNIIFRVFFYQLNCNSLQLLEESKEVLSRTDLAEAKTAALYVDATNAPIKAILSLRPRDSGKVKHVQKVLNALTDKITANVFEMIELTTDKDKRYSQIVAKTHTLESELVPLCWEFTKNLFDLISGGKDSRDENEKKSKIIEKAVLATNTFVRSVRDGALTVANSTHKNGAGSTDDICTLQALEKRAQFAAGNYAEYITDAFCLALLNSHES